MNLRPFSLNSVVWALAASSAAWSQTSAPPAEAASAQDKHTLPAITVKGLGERKAGKYQVQSNGSASFGDADRRDIPQSTSVIGRELLDDTMAVTMTDALRTEASVMNWYGGGGAYPNEAFQSRGFNADFNNGNVMVDGIRTNDRIATSLEVVERIEVLRGPSAYRTGFMSPGGIINLVTKKPTDEPYRAITLSGNQWGRVEAAGDMGGRFGEDDRFGYRVNASAERAKYFFDTAEGRKWMAATAFDWRIAPGHTLTLRHDETRFKSLNDIFHYTRVASDGSIPNIDPKQYFGQPWADWVGGERHTSVELKSRLSDTATLTSQTGYFGYFNEPGWITSPVAGSVQPNGNYTVSESHSHGKGKALGHQTFVQWDFGGDVVSHKLTAGIAARELETYGGSFTSTRGTNNFFNPVVLTPDPQPLPPLVKGSDIDSQGVFASDYLSYGAWHLLLAGRYERLHRLGWNTATGAQTADYRQNKFVPSAGLVFDLNDTSSLYASVSRGIEIGGVAPATASNPGATMNPMESRQVEAGVKADLLDGRMQVDLAVFRINKAAEYTDTTIGPCPCPYVQDGRQVHRGVEARITAAPLQGLSSVFSMQALDARIEKGQPAVTGNRPHNVPRLHATLFNDYSLASLPGVAVNATVEHVSEREIQDPNIATKLPAYTRLDIGARYRSGKATYRLGLENATDRRYYVVAYFGLLEPGSPRTLKASLTYEF